MRKNGFCMDLLYNRVSEGRGIRTVAQMLKLWMICKNGDQSERYNAPH